MNQVHVRRAFLVLGCKAEVESCECNKVGSGWAPLRILQAKDTNRSLVRDDDYIICVEHDLSVLDYLSDFICVLYGKPAVYGVVTLPASVREGINIFLDGNIPTENLRFREESLQFRIADTSEDYMIDKQRAYKSVCSSLLHIRHWVY